MEIERQVMATKNVDTVLIYGGTELPADDVKVKFTNEQGKEYNITAKHGQENWNLFSSVPFKKNEVICVSFEKEDLIYFPPNCLNYF